MRSALILIALVAAMSAVAMGQTAKTRAEKEILQVEKDFARAIINNDADAIAKFVADDWIIVGPDGGIIDKVRFLDVVRSGALTHASMESEDERVRIYGDTAVVTALATTKGKYVGQDFTTKERSTDIFVKQRGRWVCVFSQLTSFTKNRRPVRFISPNLLQRSSIPGLPGTDKYVGYLHLITNIM